MSDFFSPVEEDVVSRTDQHEDEERIAERARRNGPACRVFPLVREPRRVRIRIRTRSSEAPRPSRTPRPRAHRSVRSVFRSTRLMLRPTHFTRSSATPHRSDRSPFHFQSQWSPKARARIAAGGIKPKALIIAASDLACRMVHDAASARDGLDLKPLGSLTVAGVSARGNAVDPSTDDATGFIQEACDGEVVVASAQYDVPADAAREWSRAILSAVAPTEHVIVVSTIDEHDVDYAADGYRGAYVMDTAAWPRASKVEEADDARPVPAGALVTGVAAGVLTRCEVTGTAARLVLIPAPSGTAGGRGFGRGAAAPNVRGGGGVGPGFGGGVDRAAVEHATRLVQAATGVRLKTEGYASNGGGGEAVADRMRLFC